MVLRCSSWSMHRRRRRTEPSETVRFGTSRMGQTCPRTGSRDTWLGERFQVGATFMRAHATAHLGGTINRCYSGIDCSSQVERAGLGGKEAWPSLTRPRRAMKPLLGAIW